MIDYTECIIFNKKLNRTELVTKREVFSVIDSEVTSVGKWMGEQRGASLIYTLAEFNNPVLSHHYYFVDGQVFTAIYQDVEEIKKLFIEHGAVPIGSPEFPLFEINISKNIIQTKGFSTSKELMEFLEKESRKAYALDFIDKYGKNYNGKI